MHLRLLLCLALTLAALRPRLEAAFDENTCPVTTPPNPPFVPPAPYRPNPPAPGSFWYGSNSLWTLLFTKDLSPALRKGYPGKFFLWEQGYDVRREPKPDIIVVLHRLDADVPMVTSRGGTNAFFNETWQMLTGAAVPTEGCWEITSYHNGHTLTFVVSVQP
jgi:hypothetical protein